MGRLVKGSKGLVQKDEVRWGQEGPHELDATPLPTREPLNGTCAHHARDQALQRGAGPLARD